MQESNMKGMIKITKAAYASLRKADAKLSLLTAGGVDNWEWYDASLNPDGEPSYSTICDEIDEEVKAG